MLLCVAAMTFAACNEQQNGLFGTDGKPLVTVTTGEVTKITSNSVTILSYVYGDVSKYGGNIEVGIVYSEDEDEIKSRKGRICKGTLVDHRSFSTEINNLSSTQYYYLAYATVKDDRGNIYGDIDIFSTYGSHAFAVGDGKYVRFSKGNLLYQPSTKKWRFAKHQYDVYGRSAEDNIGSSDWMDLFAWGTGDDPMFVGNKNNYKRYFMDWGDNQIENDPPYTWRTLTVEEWKYLLYYRFNSQALLGLAKVNNIQGLILLPYNFKLPKGITFKSGIYIKYQANVYTTSEWEKMETAGAIFLPTNGNSGYYWSDTPDESGTAYCQSFNEGGMFQIIESRHYGHAVRLVQDL